MSNNLPSKNKTTIKDMIIANKKSIEETLPKHLDVDRFVKMSVMASKMMYGISECIPKTVIECIAKCAILGLEPGTGTGEVYLVPFGSKQGKVCTLIIGYRGFMKLARQSGEIRNIYARIVYDKEPFKLECGLNANIEHTPLPPSTRGKAIGVYAVAVFKDGGHSWDFLWEEEVLKAKRISKSGSSPSSPWVNFPEEMWKKTVIRRLAKFLPLSMEKHNRVLQQAVTTDELTEANKPQTPLIFTEDVPDMYDVDATIGQDEEKTKKKTTTKKKDNPEEKKQETKTRIDASKIDSRAFVCGGCGALKSNDEEDFDKFFELYSVDEETVDAHCLNCEQITEAKIK